MTYEDLGNIVKPKGLEVQPIKQKKENFKMSKVINWKTSSIGLLIIIVKFLEGLGVIPSNFLGIDFINVLTGLLGIFGADASKTK